MTKRNAEYLIKYDEKPDPNIGTLKDSMEPSDFIKHRTKLLAEILNGNHEYHLVLAVKTGDSVKLIQMNELIESGGSGHPWDEITIDVTIPTKLEKALAVLTLYKDIVDSIAVSVGHTEQTGVTVSGPDGEEPGTTLTIGKTETIQFLDVP